MMVVSVERPALTEVEDNTNLGRLRSRVWIRWCQGFLPVVVTVLRAPKIGLFLVVELSHKEEKAILEEWNLLTRWE